MNVTVLFFATLRDQIGQRSIVVEVAPQVNVGDLRKHLCEQYVDAAPYLQIALCSVNQEFAFDPTPLTDNAEVAFFPPVSGGGGVPEIFRLPSEPIDHDEIVAAVSTPETGAVVLFTGLVRGKTEREGHLPQTTRLHYEAYEPMALGKMQQVANEIREKFPKVIGLALVQRLGLLEVGQNTVLIACSAAHRDDGCFEAARYGIDRLKEIVPVWKKEQGADGERWIVGEYVPTVDDN
jgi:molybdopterin synthase catalytic subunit